MTWIYFFFWLLLFFVFYTYIGYGLLLSVLLKVQRIFSKKKSNIPTEIALPPMALIIPAYNEEKVIGHKISNSLSLDYPAHLLKIVVISDGSTDRTAAIAGSEKKILHLHIAERQGKAAALNRAAAFCAEDDILVFSDANSMLNPESLRLIAVHYQSPGVGGVSGEKKVLKTPGSPATDGENFYWRYESWLKKLDARFYTIVGAAGELFSIRRTLFQPIKKEIILDDFVLSLNVCKQGYTVQYEPGAVAAELPSQNLAEEEKRKIRIGAGAFQAMAEMSPLLNIFRFGKLSFQYISRRVFRWVLCPPALPLLLFLNIFIVVRGTDSHFIYVILLWCQFVFYVFAFFGWMINKAGLRKINVLYYPFYFLFMNLSVWAGFLKYLTREQSALWERSERSEGMLGSGPRKNT